MASHTEPYRIEIDGVTYQRIPDEFVQLAEEIAAENDVPVCEAMNILWKQFMTPRRPGESLDDWATRFGECEGDFPGIYLHGGYTLR